MDDAWKHASIKKDSLSRAAGLLANLLLFTVHLLPYLNE